MVLWILIGLVSISMFTGCVSSGLTASGMAGEIVIYGTPVSFLYFVQYRSITAKLRACTLPSDQLIHTHMS